MNKFAEFYLPLPQIKGCVKSNSSFSQSPESTFILEQFFLFPEEVSGDPGAQFVYFTREPSDQKNFVSVSRDSPIHTLELGLAGLIR